MEKRYYIDGKCVLSYDDDVFSTDDDYTNIKELFIYPAVDKVYVKYYEKQLVQQVLEKTLKKNDSIFNTYCAIKELIKDEPISVDYVQSEEDTLLKNLMRKNLNSDEYVEFEKLLDEAGINATTRIQNNLKELFTSIEVDIDYPPNEKDWNDYLVFDVNGKEKLDEFSIIF